MSKPKVTIHDLETGEIVEREMNAQEFAQWEKDQAEAQAQLEARQKAANARVALLEKLGITEEEAKLLLA